MIGYPLDNGNAIEEFYVSFVRRSVSEPHLVTIHRVQNPDRLTVFFLGIKVEEVQIFTLVEISSHGLVLSIQVGLAQTVFENLSSVDFFF